MSLPLPSQGYSVEDQSQTRSQIVQQLLQQQASLQQLKTQVDGYPVWDLRHHAALAGITLGQGNDQPAFDAAHAAMAALAPKQMLYVWVPPMTSPYSVDQLKIYNCAGFYCGPGSAMLRQKAQTTPKPIVAFAELDDLADQGSTAAAWLLYGFKIDGAWALDWTAEGGVDESDPALFHYAASEYSGGDPDRSASIGQAGVFLRGAFADAAFPTISDNAPFSYGDGDARFLVGELDICNVGGDGFFLQGSGAAVVGPIRTHSTGGRGIVINAYDLHCTVLDAGGCGLEGIVLRSQCSDVRISAAKAWFTGLRANAGNTAKGGSAADAGHQNGCWIDQCGDLTAVIEVQDSVGSAFRIASPVCPQLTLRANWIGLPPSQMTADCGGADLVATRYANTASQAGRIELSVDPGFIEGAGPYPHVRYAVDAAAPIIGTRLLLDQLNLPGDDTSDFVQPYWLQSTAVVYGSESPRLPAAGQTLVLNAADVAFGAVADLTAVAAAINAAAIPRISAAVANTGALAITCTGSPAGVLALSGSAAAGLGFTTGTTDAASYYDHCRVSFGSLERAVNQWAANSEGYINFGLNMNGATAGAGATTGGQANLTSVGRGQTVQMSCYDPEAGAFTFPARGGLDASGKVLLGFYNIGTLVSQPTAAGHAETTAPGSGAEAHVDTSYTGDLGATSYTVGDIVNALKQLGLLTQ